MKKPNQNNYQKKLSKKKDKAYFTSKSELLSWINSTLDLDIKGIEQTITGAIFCQLLDAAHPGTVRMNKVNWKAKLETEYISNFKIFQQGLLNNNIEKPININRLSKGKTQELIELLQWLYGHHISLGINPSNYDAKKKRNGQNFNFYEDKVNNINTINNNKNIRDDLSQCSSNTDFKDYQIKNHLKNKINSNNLNSNLKGDNFHKKYNQLNQCRDNSALKNTKNFDKNSNNNKSSSHSHILSSLSNEQKKEDIIKNNNIITSPFIIKEKPEENIKEKKGEEINNILFERINDIDKENLLELEKKDGNSIHDLKILLRKERINNIIYKNNLGIILRKVKKERDFYLNKLKDIEYLYFNQNIKNTYEDRHKLLKAILISTSDSTITIDEQGIASITGSGKHYPLINNYTKKCNNNNDEDINLIDKKNNKNIIVENNDDNNKNCNNKNKKNPITVKYIFSKSNTDIMESKNITNKTQPNNNSNQCIENENNINGIFSIKNNVLKSNKGKSVKKDNYKTNSPFNKNCKYNISPYILNEPLRISSNKNNKQNVNNMDLD